MFVYHACDFHVHHFVHWSKARATSKARPSDSGVVFIYFFHLIFDDKKRLVLKIEVLYDLFGPICKADDTSFILFIKFPSTPSRDSLKAD